MVNDKLSPSTFPSAMVDLPNIVLVVSPLSLFPSTLNTKVRSIVPLGPSAVAFHVPAISPATAATANATIRIRTRFMAPFLPQSFLHLSCFHRWRIVCGDSPMILEGASVLHRKAALSRNEH